MLFLFIFDRIETMELIWDNHESNKNCSLVSAFHFEVNIVLILISTFSECLLCIDTMLTILVLFNSIRLLYLKVSIVSIYR